MRRTRWNHGAGFKAKVALAANPDLDPRHERAANLVAEIHCLDGAFIQPVDS